MPHTRGGKREASDAPQRCIRRTKTRNGCMSPEKMRVTFDADGLAAVKAKACRKKMRTMQRQMLPRWSRSFAPTSADSRMHRPRRFETVIVQWQRQCKIKAINGQESHRTAPYCATPDLNYLPLHGQAIQHQSGRRRYLCHHAHPRSRRWLTAHGRTPHAAPSRHAQSDHTTRPIQDAERTLSRRGADRWRTRRAPPQKVVVQSCVHYQYSEQQNHKGARGSRTTPGRGDSTPKARHAPLRLLPAPPAQRVTPPKNGVLHESSIPILHLRRSPSPPIRKTLQKKWRRKQCTSIHSLLSCSQPVPFPCLWSSSSTPPPPLRSGFPDYVLAVIVLLLVSFAVVRGCMRDVESIWEWSSEAKREFSRLLYESDRQRQLGKWGCRNVKGGAEEGNESKEKKGEIIEGSNPKKEMEALCGSSFLHMRHSPSRRCFERKQRKDGNVHTRVAAGGAGVRGTDRSHDSSSYGAPVSILALLCRNQEGVRPDVGVCVLCRVFFLSAVGEGASALERKEGRRWQGMEDKNMERPPAKADSWHSTPERYRRAGRFPTYAETCGAERVVGEERTQRPQLQDYDLERKYEEWVAAESKSGCKRIGGSECEDASYEDASVRHSGGCHPAVFPSLTPASTRSRLACAPPEAHRKCHRPATSGRTRCPQWKIKAKKKGYEACLDAHNDAQLRIVSNRVKPCTLKCTVSGPLGMGTRRNPGPGNETQDKDRPEDCAG
ncbi:hypothetical protein B0H13DRAFT_1893356 [Mycena leptocephala]|nr:hypothetical protein B0H13DRAFT_1893356 [Mycena leptocephala]